MNTPTKKQIVDIINKNGAMRPADLARELDISTQAVHRHLKKLLEQGQLKRHGKAPLVFYSLAKEQKKVDFSSLSKEESQYIDDYFSYLSPSGELTHGLLAFGEWLKSTKQIKVCKSVATAFVKQKESALALRNSKGYLDLTPKVSSTFEKCFLDKVVCTDFYSLPQFGKTHLGNLVMAGKSGQSRAAIKEIADVFKPFIEQFIKQHSINYLVWIPHSIPRKIELLIELEKLLGLSQPKIQLTKAYTGDIPVPQKSLSKLEDRIANAQDTIFLKDKSDKYTGSALIIDDALGSGATVNEIARKLRNHTNVTKIYGIVVVGSFKGFDVISEI